MSAKSIVRRLIEEPENDPLGLDPLEPYVGPVAFNTNIKDIIDRAISLKQQATQAGAMQTLVKIYGNIKDQNIDRAFLILAVKELEKTESMPTKICQRLRRLMQSVWD